MKLRSGLLTPVITGRLRKGQWEVCAADRGEGVIINIEQGGTIHTTRRLLII